MPRNHSPVHIPKDQERTSTKARLDAAKAGKDLPVTLGDMMDQQVGTIPGPEVRAVMELSTAIHRAESVEWSISWSAQEQARAFFNEHGFVATLDEATRLKPLAKQRRKP
jgi:hypothetical protein